MKICRKRCRILKMYIFIELNNVFVHAVFHACIIEENVFVWLNNRFYSLSPTAPLLAWTFQFDNHVKVTGANIFAVELKIKIMGYFMSACGQSISKVISSGMFTVQQNVSKSLAICYFLSFFFFFFFSFLLFLLRITTLLLLIWILLIEFFTKVASFDE